jgi:hypothetical protein
MITPTFALNFTTASLDPRVSFTRSGNTATVQNADGSITLVNADTPRFDYSGGICKGLLIEEARTNLVLNSVLNGATTGVAGTPPTSWITGTWTGNLTSINTSQYVNGKSLTFTVSGERVWFYQSFSLSSNTTYFFKATFTVTSGSIAPNQLITTSALPAGAGTAYFSNGIAINPTESLAAGTYTIGYSVTVAATAGAVFMRFGAGCASVQTCVVTMDMPQVETGAFGTSYIPTTTTTVTRNADVATMTGTNFSDFWQADKGGASVLATPSTVSGIRPLVQFDDNTANEIIALRGNTTNPELYIVDGGTPQAQLDAGTIAANTAYSFTGWWATNDCKARQDAGAVVTDTTATIPTVTQMRIGSDGTNYLNGTIATIGYYDSFFGRPIYTRRKNKVFASLL